MLRIYRLKKLTHIVLIMKNSVSLYQIGWPFSCHLLIGRNVKDLSPEKFILHRFSKKMDVTKWDGSSAATN